MYFKREKKRDNSIRRTYFPTPEDFFDTWILGYKNGDSHFGKSKVYDSMGFELQYININPNSEFFEIGNHTGISKYTGKIDSFLLCADANELYDQKGYMNLGVNDIRDTSVKVYRGKDYSHENIKYSQVGDENFPKIFDKDKHYYVWDGKEKFPFVQQIH